MIIMQHKQNLSKFSSENINIEKIIVHCVCPNQLHTEGQVIVVTMVQPVSEASIKLIYEE